jgi:hypothetical protein
MLLSLAKFWQRLIRGVVAAVVVIAIVLLLLEVAGRIADPAGISYYPEAANMPIP